MADKEDSPLGPRVGKLEGRVGRLENTVGNLGIAQKDCKDLQAERHEDTKHLVRRLELWLMTILAAILVAIVKLFLTK